VTPGGTITTIAGGGPGLTGRSGLATKAHLNHPTGVAVDAKGNVYIADISRVYKVSPRGTLTTFAGRGKAGFAGDGQFAITARLEAYGVAVDSSGNVYIADSVNHRVREVHAGLMTTFAGDGEASSGGDGNAATLSHLIDPTGVAVDAQGNVYIADQAAGRVRKVNHAGKIHTLTLIKTIAGNGKRGFGGDGGPATRAPLHNPVGVAVDAQRNVYVTELDSRVRKIAPDGTITTVAGLGPNQTSKSIGNGGPANRATLSHPGGMAFDQHGNLYVADTAHAAIRKIWFGTPVGP
jgi:sugar lactone lactonase YvrE